MPGRTARKQGRGCWGGWAIAGVIVVEIHRLAEQFPAMPEQEFQAFKEDIAARGLINPLWLFEGRILDGRNRYRACLELGVDPVFAEFEGDEEAARSFVDSQNLHRRHLTPEQQKERRAARVQRVAEKRAEGKSIRAIAAEEGVSKSQVVADLGEVSTPCTPAPAKIEGKDGKQYPASRPSPASPRPPDRPRPQPQQKPPPTPWDGIAEQLSRVASLIESSGPVPEGEKPWKLVESLESTAPVLLRRATELRKRHHL